LDENKTYTMATSDFTTTGGDGYIMVKDLKNVGELGNTDEAFLNYLNEVGVGGIEVGRIKRLVDVPIPD
ncbi:MAG: hypothetical protein J5497_04830, partial [Selenomonadaceae bacterium]|nr:hypothetical protein [Selenomonadaceae bacterium]